MKTTNRVRTAEADEYIRARQWQGHKPDYTFTTPPTLKHRYVQKLIVIQKFNQHGIVPTWSKVLEITDPKKLKRKNWGSSTRTYLSGCGYIHVHPDNAITITSLGLELITAAVLNSKR